VTRILSFNGKKFPKNQIVKELSDKVAHAIFALQPEPFHIYITLPVHPEGLLKEGSIMATIHQTMQTISFGSDSLLNRIRKHLWVYQQLIKDEVPRKEWGKMRSAYYDKIGNDYQTIPLEECGKYVTLLNLRSWAQLGDRTVTEQIYVHSKLTIVDDLYVLVGSANIN
ncbi:Phosphatidylserine/phosphatidylglycerophosphate/cardiolipin synthase, partial [Gilliamella apicola SCGC AB-598-B02]